MKNWQNANFVHELNIKYFIRRIRMNWRRKVGDNQFIDLRIQDSDKGESKDFKNVQVRTTIQRLEQMVSV